MTLGHPEAGRGPTSAVAGRLLWTGITCSIALGAIGTVLTPDLSTHHPLVMLWVESADRNLLLARHVAVVPYVIAGSVRRLVSDPLFYLAGHWYGERALRRLEPHLGRRTVQLTERLFRRAAYPMLVLFTGRTVSILAGVAGVPVVPFAVIVVARTVAVVVLLRWLGGVFGTDIDAVLHVFNAYVVPATVIIAVALVAVALITHRRERRQATS